MPPLAPGLVRMLVPQMIPAGPVIGEIAAVEKEIQSHNQHVEALTHRLEGLKRADELLESDQAAIAELLQTSIANGSGFTRELPPSPAAKVQKATTGAKAAAARKQVGRNSQIGRRQDENRTQHSPNFASRCLRGSGSGH
jgi:hypothetical protein